jgi:hypothetical protein
MFCRLSGCESVAIWSADRPFSFRPFSFGINVVATQLPRLDAGSLLELARKREPSIDRATVYRTIELLKSSGWNLVELVTRASPRVRRLQASRARRASPER